jgi:hypothetical protein
MTLVTYRVILEKNLGRQIMTEYEKIVEGLLAKKPAGQSF